MVGSFKRARGRAKREGGRRWYDGRARTFEAYHPPGLREVPMSAASVLRPKPGAFRRSPGDPAAAGRPAATHPPGAGDRIPRTLPPARKSSTSWRTSTSSSSSTKTSGLVAVLRGGKSLSTNPAPRRHRRPAHARGDRARLRERGRRECTPAGTTHTAMLRSGPAAGRPTCRDRRQVVFMFQPGEEGFGGAEVTLREGMPDFDACFALHVAPRFRPGGGPAGAIMASFDDFEIEVRGQGATRRCPPTASIRSRSPRRSFSPSRATSRADPTHDPGVLTVSQIHAGTTSNGFPTWCA